MFYNSIWQQNKNYRCPLKNQDNLYHMAIRQMPNAFGLNMRVKFAYYRQKMRLTYLIYFTTTRKNIMLQPSFTICVKSDQSSTL